LLIAAVAISIALFVSGAVLARLFTHHIEEREYAELANHQNQIIAAISIDADGRLSLSTSPADPRFFLPNGGLYWQIDLPDGSKERSRSLWETELKLPVDEFQDGTPHRHIISGPNSTTLLATERGLTVGPDRGAIPIRLTVAADRADIDRAAAEFRSVLIMSLGVLGLALLSALVIQVEVGLRPLGLLRTALQNVHKGSVERVEGQFPLEVEPLIIDMNALLDRERLNNTRARERAADLAHGFKTPLAILATVSRDVLREGQVKSAEEIKTQIDIMGRHVRRELSRARTVGASTIGQTSVRVRPVFTKIVAALGRISADRALIWTIEVDDAVAFFGDENDLLELLGNLADNAAKWATSSVTLKAFQGTTHLTLCVEDDGHGIPDGAETEILVRGRRLDESTGGTGLGLSIVAKIVEAYNGTISVSRAPKGGLAVLITLPGPIGTVPSPQT
jgi:signal transduction histidine kinase